MTDTRLPSEWLLGPLVRLKPTAFRSYVCALMWSVANRTDGLITGEDLAYIPGFDPGDIRELMAKGMWRVHRARDNEWLIADFKRTQTSCAEHEVLENARRREREKKQRQRAKAAASPDPVPGDSTGGQYPGTAQAGRQAGKEGLEERGTSPARVDGPGEKDDWPEWRGRGPDPFEEYR